MYDVTNKKRNLETYNKLTLNKTIAMFEWQDLPDTIPYRELERMLQTNGYVFITEVEGQVYAFNGGLGGVPDVYGNPTTITISNPALNFFKTLDINEDGVLIRNDDMQLGLWEIFDRFNSALVESDISINMVVMNSRMQTLISASDDRTKASAELFLEKAKQGELAVVGENAMFDGINTHSVSPSPGSGITSLIEYHQYVKASMHNELGLNSNFNMKRARLTADEVGAVEDTLYPLIDNMMKSRIRGVEAVNEKYDLWIDVDYGSIWSRKNREMVDGVIDDDEPEDETVAETPEEAAQDTKDEDPIVDTTEPETDDTGDSEAIEEPADDDSEEETDPDVDVDVDIDIDAEPDSDDEDKDEDDFKQKE